MPKKKKTRKQKMLANTRHKEYFLEPLQSVKPEHSESLKPYSPQPNPNQAIVTSHYNYLYSDLLKTLLLTILVIMSELALRYFAFGA